MIKVLRLTDLHLNFLLPFELEKFFQELSEIEVDAIFLTGDIADGPSIKSILLKFIQFTTCPIYYVLGNHDLYWTSFNKVYHQLQNLHERLFLLDVCQPILLGEIALIGSTGWFDAGWHKPLLPLVFIADWAAIDDFSKIFSYKNFLKEIDNLSKTYSSILKKKLRDALQMSNKICMLTHFPPTQIKRNSFLGKLWWDPYDSSRHMYDIIKKEMIKFPTKHLQVFAGHIHQNYQEQLLPNVHLNVAEATLGDLKKGQLFFLKG